MDSPKTQLVQTNLPSLFTVLHKEMAPFRAAMDEAVLAHAGVSKEDLETIDQEGAKKVHEAMAEINHLDAITLAVEANPRAAARAIMPMIYMSGANFIAQDQVHDPVGGGIPAEVVSGGEPEEVGDEPSDPVEAVEAVEAE